MVNKDLSTLCINLKYENRKGLYTLVDTSKLSCEKIDNPVMNIYAYAPYVEDKQSTIENHRVEVHPDQSDLADYLGSDFLYAKVDDIALSDNAVNLSFENKLAKLIININKVDLLNGGDVDFEIINVATSTGVNLYTGVLSIPENIGSIKPFRNQKGNTGFNYRLEAILVPQKISANTLLFKLKLDGKEYCYTTKNDINFDSSMMYIYNITVDNNSLSVECEELSRARENISNSPDIIFERTYKIGDYYPIADDPLSAIGVVFYTTDDGTHGKIISLDEIIGLKWGPLMVTGTRSRILGTNNQIIIQRQAHSIAEYEAFNWCLSKGKDWYLPAINELVAIYKQKDILNKSLSPLLRSSNLGDEIYMSSTEYNTSDVLVFHFENGQCFHQNKRFSSRVRGVLAF